MVRTLQGLETPIPASCASWTDGCTIYCRVGPTEYDRCDLDRRCIQDNITRPRCEDAKQNVMEICQVVKRNYANGIANENRKCTEILESQP